MNTNNDTCSRCSWQCTAQPLRPSKTSHTKSTQRNETNNFKHKMLSSWLWLFCDFLLRKVATCFSVTHTHGTGLRQWHVKYTGKWNAYAENTKGRRDADGRLASLTSSKIESREAGRVCDDGTLRLYLWYWLGNGSWLCGRGGHINYAQKHKHAPAQTQITDKAI